MAYNNVKVSPRQVVPQNQQTKDLGIVSPVPMGQWQANVSYQKLNIVRYNGASYIAKKQNTGFEPTITTGWQEIWQVISLDGSSPDLSGYATKQYVDDSISAAITTALNTPV